MSVDNFHFSPVSGVSLIFFILLSLAGALQLQLLTTLLLTHSKQVLRFLPPLLQSSNFRIINEREVWSAPHHPRHIIWRATMETRDSHPQPVFACYHYWAMHNACTIHKWIHPMNLINFLFSKLLENCYLMYIEFYIFVDLLFLFVSMSGQFPETVLKLFHNFTLSLKFKTLIECS